MCVGVWSTHGGSDNFSSTHGLHPVLKWPCLGGLCQATLPEKAPEQLEQVRGIVPDIVLNKLVTSIFGAGTLMH